MSNLTAVKCTRCGKEFNRLTSILKYWAGKPTYCSEACSGKARNKRVTLACDYCGKEFEKKRALVRKRNFCDKSCADKSLIKPPNIQCGGCGKPIHKNPYKIDRYKVHYCSKACRGIGDRTMIDVSCHVCGKVFKKKPAMIKRTQRNFCSHGCYHKWMGTEESHNWKGGISFEPYTAAFNDKLKEQIRGRDGYTCQLCDMRQSDSPRKLDIHHIDYQKDNCHPSNLVALCRKCNVRCNGDRNEWTKHFQLYQKRRGIKS